MNMKQENRLDWLLSYLLNERNGQGNIEVPEIYAEKRVLFRGLVNVRSPRPVSADFLKVQDAFLQKEVRHKGIVKLEDIQPCTMNNCISLWQGDITRLAVEAIVNAANSEMLGCFMPGHYCIDNAIHTAAGIQLRGKCHEIMQEQGCHEMTGNAKITEGFNLPAKYIIHTVGPIAKGKPTKAQENELAQCYCSCLELAALHGIKSIAFCCISTGVFAFPKAPAAKIAVNTVLEYLKERKQPERVIFNVFTDKDYIIYKRLLYTHE